MSHQPSMLWAASGVNNLSIKMVQDCGVCVGGGWGGAVHQNNDYISSITSYHQVFLQSGNPSAISLGLFA